MSVSIPLSDASMTMLLQLAAPLAVDDRSAFLEAVATRLATEPVIGDGIVARIAADEQRRLLQPVDPWAHAPKWSRHIGRPPKAVRVG